MTTRSSIRSLLVASLVAGLVTVPTAAWASIFTDGFESGTTSAWTTNVGGVTVEQSGPFAPAPEGTMYARMQTAGTPAYLREMISLQPSLYVDVKVNVASAPAGMTLIRLTTASGAQLVSLKIDKVGKLLFKNHVSGVTPKSTTVLTTNAWHELELHAAPNGLGSLTEVWLDGAQVTDLTSTASLGTTPIGAVLLGTKGTTSGFDAAFDAVTFDTTRGGQTPPGTPTNLHEVSHGPTTASIAWDAVSGATGYGVYRDGVALQDIPSASFIDSGLLPSTSYQYTVDAFNSAGRSGQSAPILVTTSAEGGGGPSIVVRAAGDIACDPADVDFNGGAGSDNGKKCQQMATSDLLVGADNVLALGDTQYVCGGTIAYQQSYDPSWGRFKSITWAVPADQEYATTGGTDCSTGAAGYYNYFGDRGGSVTATPLPGVSQSTIPGVYSFNLPEGCTVGVDCTWHIVALNSVCSQVGGCGSGSPMEQWLLQDLSANSWATCTAAMLHVPRFASKANTSKQINNQVLALWEDFVAVGVEFVLSGNSHFYERLAPQDALGNAVANGTVQWIVGTGGRGHGGIADPGLRLPNSEAGQKDTFGVLQLTLQGDGYGWDFLPVAGGTFTDSGSRACT